MMKKKVFLRKYFPVLISFLTLLGECMPFACSVTSPAFDMSHPSEKFLTSYFGMTALNYAGMFPLVAGVLTALMLIASLLRLWEPSQITDRFYLITSVGATFCCGLVCITCFSVLPVLFTLLAGFNVYVAVRLLRLHRKG